MTYQEMIQVTIERSRVNWEQAYATHTDVGENYIEDAQEEFVVCFLDEMRRFFLTEINGMSAHEYHELGHAIYRYFA